MNPAENKASCWWVMLLWWLGLALVLLTWETASWSQPRYVLSEPTATWETLLGLIRDEGLGAEVLLIPQRVLDGLGIICLIGLPWGWTAGTWRPVEELTASWTQLLMAIPLIVIAVVGMPWLGPSSSAVLLVVALVTMPLLVINLHDAVANVDPDLLEMARLFCFGLWGTVQWVIIPAVMSPVLSAAAVVVGQLIQLTVMAELLSTTIGLGAEMQQARTNLGTADAFALLAMVAILTLGLELLPLRPLRNHLARYR